MSDRKGGGEPEKWREEKMKTAIICLAVIVVGMAALFLAKKHRADPRNIVGQIRGYSGCGHCGGTWNWKEPHYTPYSDSGKMFPLCEECFDELSVERAFDYHLQLWRSWQKWGRPPMTATEGSRILNEITKAKGGTP